MGRSAHNSPISGRPALLSELLAGLSLAGDLGMGRPADHTLRATYLAGVLAERMNLAEEERADLFYVALMKGIGCVAEEHELAAILAGDEIALRGAGPLAGGDPMKMLPILLRYVGAAEPALGRPAAVMRFLARGLPVVTEGLRAHCEVGAVLAQRLGLSERTQQGLLSLFETWNGHGPNAKRGQQIPLASRVVGVATFAEIFFTASGPEAAFQVLRAQAGSALDPEIVAAFISLAIDRPPWPAFEGTSFWSEVLALEPPSRRLSVDDGHIDDIAAAFGDLADLKSPYTVGHSNGVARIADGAAQRLRLPPADRATLRRAALVHDLGVVAVPNVILDRARELTVAEWERVRLHPYHSERILARAGPLAPLGPLAGAHHERLDGSGYHRGLHGPQLPIGARVLGAADMHAALSEARPQRPARSASAVREALREEVRQGHLDGDCATAVLETAAGEPRHLRSLPGLSEREVEVLRLLACGLSRRDIARNLIISETTARHHVEHIYDKLGVSTRAAAVMAAVARGLATGGE